MSRGADFGAPGQEANTQRAAPTRRPPIYERLDPSEPQIRVLTLLPSRVYQSPIQCALTVVSLEEEPRYEALSYVWGDPNVCGQVHINGRAVDITINLEAALRRLRRGTRYRHLWVDALCINQSDDVEKSQQVDLMGDIYSDAVHAILWLGDYTENTLPDQHEHQPESGFLNTIPREKVDLAFNLMNLMAADHHYLSQGESRDQGWDDRAMDALESLMQLPWWTRIWTVQEAVLPRQATIMCGTKQLRLESFFEASANCIAHFDDGCCVGENGVQPFPIFVTTAQPMRLLQSPTYNSITFAYALKAFRSRQATDPRDCVFGLLGLGGNMAADYSLSQHEVFIRSARRLIADTNSLFPLLRTYEMHRTPDLPTWVPDWCAESDKPYKSADMAWIYQYRYYNAAGRTTPQIRETSSNSMLELLGFEVDEVEEVGECCGCGEPDDVYIIAHWQDMIDQRCYDGNRRYPCGGTYEDAFWRLMTVDMVLAKDEMTRSMGVRRARPEDEASCRRKWDTNGEIITEVLQTSEKRFFITRQGLIGVANRDVSPGDVVHLLLGGQMPFVLRPIELHDQSDSCHEYVGETYVHGIMDGRMMKDGREAKWVRLV